MNDPLGGVPNLDVAGGTKAKKIKMFITFRKHRKLSDVSEAFSSGLWNNLLGSCSLLCNPWIFIFSRMEVCGNFLDTLYIVFQGSILNLREDMCLFLQQFKINNSRQKGKRIYKQIRYRQSYCPQNTLTIFKLFVDPSEARDYFINSVVNQYEGRWECCF